MLGFMIDRSPAAKLSEETIVKIARVVTCYGEGLYQQSLAVHFLNGQVGFEVLSLLDTYWLGFEVGTKYGADKY